MFKKLLLIAVLCFSTGVFAQSNDAIDVLNEGGVLHKAGRFKEAIIKYSQAINMYRDFKEAYINRSNCYTILEEYAKAVLDLDKAIALETEDAKMKNLLMWRAYNRGEIGDFFEACVDIKMSLKIDPNYAEAYRIQGLIKMWLDDHTGAVEDLTTAISLKPAESIFYYDRGIAKSKMLDTGGACADWDKAFKMGYNKAISMIEAECE